jgi:hypothetical protein
MSISTDNTLQKGAKIRFIERHPYMYSWGVPAQNSEKLVYGETYTVDRVVVHKWYTAIYLQEFPDLSMNSIWFEKVVEND